MSGPRTNNEVAERAKAASQQNPYAEAVNSGTSHIGATAADGFTLVKRRTRKNPREMDAPTAVAGSRKTRAPLTGVRSSSPVPVVAKKTKTLSLCVSRFISAVTLKIHFVSS